jgi:hypothetical protein
MLRWHKVLSYALALFATQFLVGFLEGLLLPPSPANLFDTRSVASALVSLVLCAAIFTHLAIHQVDRTLGHASLALLAQFILGELVSLVSPMWLVATADVGEIGKEALVLLLALAVGTAFGNKLRKSHEPGAEA